MSLTEKGRLRRQLLLDAVTRVLAEVGPGGVTHRAVAAEAGVPLAAATYYFDSIDDLLLSALRSATEQQVTLFAPLRNGDLAGFAAALFLWVHGDRPAAIAQYELLFLAMRRDSLRDDAELWYRSLESAVREYLSPAVAPAGTALAIDGLLLQMLWRGEPGSVGEVQALLGEILGAPGGTGSGSSSSSASAAARG